MEFKERYPDRTTLLIYKKDRDFLYASMLPEERTIADTLSRILLEVRYK